MKTNKLLYGMFFLLIVFLNSASGQNPDNPSSITHVIEVEKGIDLHIVDWGGTGEPLLFVPSWTATSHVFDTFAPRFVDQYHVLVMNKRGHGPSTRPDQGYTIERLIKDIEVILDELDIERVNLVGLSRSSSLISHFAASFPDRVERLIYLSGPIDRSYSQSFYAKPENQKAFEKRRELFFSLINQCKAEDPSTPYPQGSIDESAEKIGVEWRDNDPSPPYSEIKVPALAFWALGEIGKEQLLRKICERQAEDQTKAIETLEQFTQASFPFYNLQMHDISIFEQQMEKGKIRIIPTADYYTYLSHPELVEFEIREFLKIEK